MAGLNYRRRIRVGSVGTEQITLPLPRFGCLYAADLRASFRRGFLRLGTGEPTEPHRGVPARQGPYRQMCESETEEGAEPGPNYSAKDIRISNYRMTDMAAFRLVGNHADSTVQNHLNAGTLLRRNRSWQVVA